MKKTIGIILLVCGLHSCEQAPQVSESQTVVNSDDTKILRNLKEVQWPKAYREQDTLLLNTILGDDFQMIDAAGTWSTKKDELEWIKENAMQPDSFRYEIKRLDIFDNGTAIVCGTGHVHNDSIKTIYQSSNILIKRNGIWKAVASHVSGIRQLGE